MWLTFTQRARSPDPKQASKQAPVCVSCGSGWSVPCVSIQLTLSQTSKQAKANKQASKISKQASKQASKQTSKQASFTTLLVRSERSHADQCAAMKTAMDGPQARFTIERLSHVGKHEQHASVSVSGSGHISLPLRPPFPTPLATGVLVCAGLGTCVFRLISLLASGREPLSQDGGVADTAFYYTGR
jgi:hypothetical protein